jgi:hypothetical protein
MILDKNLAFDGDGTTPVAVTVTRDSTNVIDLAVASDLSIGEDLYISVLSNGLFAAGGGATLTISFLGSPDNSTWVTYNSTPALSIAQLNSRVVGGMTYPLSSDVPSRLPGGVRPRYLKMAYTVATGPFTAGALHAFLNLGRDQPEAYPKNYDTTYV